MKTYALSEQMLAALLWLTEERSVWGGPGDLRPYRGREVPVSARTLDALISRGLAEKPNSIRATEEGCRVALAHREYVARRDRLVTAIEEVETIVREEEHGRSVAAALASRLDCLTSPLVNGTDPVVDRALSSYL